MAASATCRRRRRAGRGRGRRAWALRADAPPVRAFALTKRYDDVLAVDAVDLTVESGDVYGFLGPNGAGKTTTLRMIWG